MEGVRQTAAALRGCGVDDAVLVVERIRLAVAGNELLRRRDVLTVGEIDLVQPAVPGHGVDRVLARRHLHHRRHGGLSARAEHVVDGRLIREPVLEPPAPEHLTVRDIDREEVVGDARHQAHLERTLRRRHALGDERRKEVVHRAGGAVELNAPQQLRRADVGGREDLLVLHPTGTSGIDALHEDISGRERCGRLRAAGPTRTVFAWT